MKFGSVYFFMLVFLWLPVIAFYLFLSKEKRARFFAFFSPSQQRELFNLSEKLLWMRRMFLISALIALTLAAARPQFGSSEIHAKSEGIDIAVVFDVSLSMLAEDEDGPRFEKARTLLVDAVSELKGDRVSLVPFAGAAFLQLPLTADYNTVLSVLSDIRPGVVESQGTALNNALAIAAESLKSGSDQAERLIVLFSDGEDPSLDFSAVKKLLDENRIKLAVMPLGSVDGAPVKVGESYLKDERGETVVSRVKKDFFDKAIKELGAFEIKKSETLSVFIDGFKKKAEREEKSIRFFDEKFQIPLLIGIFFFFLFMAAPAGRKER